MNASKKNSRKLILSDPVKRPLCLRVYPDPVLRKKCAPVTTYDRMIHDLANDMLIFMREHKGIGLAAPQVGILKEIIVADIGLGQICLINPKITHHSGSEKLEERCLSLPEYFLEIRRNTHITVSGFDPEGKKVKMEIQGLLARVIQHEIDHLHGTLICDYAPLRKGGGIEVLKN
ncbi:MAG: peptide deformylase [Candidatus Aureabacteria bacterium]|nr:peptide deformylase [Candidatus Auribacterota bacterium]